MDTKVYEKTRYQNIYRHKKNKNYLIMISKPVKSSISSIDGEKIYKLEDALKIRDNPKIKLQKAQEIRYKDDLDSLWDKYMFHCQFVEKQAYNTFHKKQLIYNKYLRNIFKKPVSKYNKENFVRFIDNLDTTIVMKNHIIKHLKTFLNWCVSEEILFTNPVINIKFYKVAKKEMKYWLPNEVRQFFNFMNTQEGPKAYRTKILVLLGFSLGDRIGETRALTFGSINKNKSTIIIKHSINYDPNSEDVLSSTKNYQSQREIIVSKNLIEEIEKYKYYLINELDYKVDDDTLIFFNHSTQKPISDSKLRNDFYEYCELANVPRIRPYDLRHTYTATMMAEGKELYLISERLGHSSYSTTVNKYGHLSNQIKKEVAEITDKYLK